MLPFTMQQLNEAVLQGRVTSRPHPTLPYRIYNYTPSVQFSNGWDDITTTCRGLILDEDGDIVARPWRKFFNLGQVNLPMQFTDPVEVMDKADGSLGILYPVTDKFELGDAEYAIATRGSFTSEQALHATEVWKTKYSDMQPIPGFTMLFEIVYPENRIVLDYDGMDDLILLGAVETEAGFYYGPNEAKWLWESNDRLPTYKLWPGPIVDVYDYNTVTDALAQMGRVGKEGYVIRHHNFLVKVKEPDYLEMHKLVTNLSAKTIWDQLRSGKSVSQVCEVLPDEFHDYARSFAKPLQDQFNSRLSEIRNNYSRLTKNLGRGFSRKEFAGAVAGDSDAKFYFLLFDNKPIDEVLWGSLRPRAED